MDCTEPITPWAVNFRQNIEQIGHHGPPPVPPKPQVYQAYQRPVYIRKRESSQLLHFDDHTSSLDRTTPSQHPNSLLISTPGERQSVFASNLAEGLQDARPSELASWRASTFPTMPHTTMPEETNLAGTLPTSTAMDNLRSNEQQLKHNSPKWTSKSFWEPICPRSAQMAPRSVAMDKSTLDEQHPQRISYNMTSESSRGSRQNPTAALSETDKMTIRISHAENVVPAIPHVARTTATSNTLVIAAINNASTMSLRKWLHWIVGLREIHDYQSLSHTQVNREADLYAPTITVLRNLQVLAKMYEPDRVWLPSQEVWEVVATIHGILMQQKRDMEQKYEEIQLQSRTLTSSAFIEWLSYRYRVVGRKLKLVSAGWFHDPDSISDQIDETWKAMEFYKATEVAYDQSDTNTFSDVIIKALAGYHKELRDNLSTFRQMDKYKREQYVAKQRRRRKEEQKQVAKDGPAPQSSHAEGDWLLFRHASPDQLR